MTQSATRATPIDFATRSVFTGESTRAEFDGEAAQDARTEIQSTVAELIEAFGAPMVARCLNEIPSISQNELSDERIARALRSFAVIIMEADHPKYAAQLVSKAARAELTTGATLDLTALGASVGVSKQAASKKLAEYCQRLDLPRLESSPASRESHRLMNRRNYATKSRRTA